MSSIGIHVPLSEGSILRLSGPFERGISCLRLPFVTLMPSPFGLTVAMVPVPRPRSSPRKRILWWRAGGCAWGGCRGGGDAAGRWLPGEAQAVGAATHAWAKPGEGVVGPAFDRPRALAGLLRTSSHFATVVDGQRSDSRNGRRWATTKEGILPLDRRHIVAHEGKQLEQFDHPPRRPFPRRSLLRRRFEYRGRQLDLFHPEIDLAMGRNGLAAIIGVRPMIGGDIPEVGVA